MNLVLAQNQLTSYLNDHQDIEQETHQGLLKITHQLAKLIPLNAGDERQDECSELYSMICDCFNLLDLHQQHQHKKLYHYLYGLLIEMTKFSPRNNPDNQHPGHFLCPITYESIDPSHPDTIALTTGYIYSKDGLVEAIKRIQGKTEHVRCPASTNLLPMIDKHRLIKIEPTLEAFVTIPRAENQPRPPFQKTIYHKLKDVYLEWKMNHQTSSTILLMIGYLFFPFALFFLSPVSASISAMPILQNQELMTLLWKGVGMVSTIRLLRAIHYTILPSVDAYFDPPIRAPEFQNRAPLNWYQQLRLHIISLYEDKLLSDELRMMVQDIFFAGVATTLWVTNILPTIAYDFDILTLFALYQLILPITQIASKFISYGMGALVNVAEKGLSYFIPPYRHDISQFDKELLLISDPHVTPKLFEQQSHLRVMRRVRPRVHRPNSMPEVGMGDIPGAFPMWIYRRQGGLQAPAEANHLPPAENRRAFR